MGVTRTGGSYPPIKATAMHLAEKLHAAHLDKATIARGSSAVMLTLIVAGLGVCAFGALVFDLGRALAVW